jgi:hypothetical protein
MGFLAVWAERDVDLSSVGFQQSKCCIGNPFLIPRGTLAGPQNCPQGFARSRRA